MGTCSKLIYLHHRQLVPLLGRPGGVERTGEVNQQDPQSATRPGQVSIDTMKQEYDGFTAQTVLPTTNFSLLYHFHRKPSS